MTRDPAFQMAGQAAMLMGGTASLINDMVMGFLSTGRKRPDPVSTYSVAEVAAFTADINRLLAALVDEKEAEKAALVEEADTQRENDAERIYDLETALAAWREKATGLQAQLDAQTRERRERRPAVSISAYSPD